MISDKMRDSLNRQIELEGYASFLYLSMAVWCDDAGLSGCAQFMHRQSAEERAHMLRIFHYMSEVGVRAIVPAIPKPPESFDSARSMFEQVFAHEQKVTKSIHELIGLANAENDFSTNHFLQWYVAEQREEEALMRSILDRIKLIGDGPMQLYYIDKEVEAINQAEAAAEAAGGAEA
ncbi:MAG: ferritin [Lewinellaceae bacterium]|nr:ferritin [Lewinellaceae bacterium]